MHMNLGENVAAWLDDANHNSQDAQGTIMSNSISGCLILTSSCLLQQRSVLQRNKTAEKPRNGLGCPGTGD